MTSDAFLLDVFVFLDFILLFFLQIHLPDFKSDKSLTSYLFVLV